MNLPNNVPVKMEYIQKLFLGVQNYMQQDHDWEELITFLDAVPPEFRSVAYESASMEIALQELSLGKELNNWKKFYQLKAKLHTFHMDIGLGWAFAKTEISPISYLESLQPVMPWMIFDGVGYYHGLFKGRATVKSQMIPPGVEKEVLQGFDQGLGRRLWYICKGEVSELMQLVRPFHPSRHADLWRGVGIACGYVGGSDRLNLERLLDCSTQFPDQLRTGVGFAAISRSASNSLNPDIELACEIICGKPLQEVLNAKPGIKGRLDPTSPVFL